MARTYVVVGQLCSSQKEAREMLATLRQLDRLRGAEPRNAWGIAKIITGDGESPVRMGKIVLPPPAFLEKLEGLLSDNDVRKTRKGAAALKLIRTALKRRG